MSLEKRTHLRWESSRKFYAVVKGRRITVLAKNLSLGGAFLATETIVRPGKVLVLEAPEAMGAGPPVCTIAAKVVHFTMLPEFGAGATWVRAMCSEGMRPLRAWLADLLKFEIPDPVAHQVPMELWGKPLYWDFRRGRFFVDEAAIERTRTRTAEQGSLKVKESLWEQLGKVRVVYSEAPSQKRATMDHDVSIETRTSGKDDETSASAKDLSRWLRISRKRRATDLQAIITRLNVRMSGRVTGLDREGLVVEVANRPPPPGNRVMVDVKIEFQGMTFPVRFACEIEDVVERRDTGLWGLDLRIISTNEGPQPGILRAWLKR
ncbi:MAG: hypothetical protein ABIK09_02400 [Pseudomonadota bacterium]